MLASRSRGPFVSFAPEPEGEVASHGRLDLHDASDLGRRGVRAAGEEGAVVLIPEDPQATAGPVGNSGQVGMIGALVR